MCSSGAPEGVDSIPNDSADDSGVNVSDTVIPINPSDNLEQVHSASTSQADSDISDSITTVVKTVGDHSTDDTPPAEPITIRPKSINLDELPLHSPIPQILGTPFANDNIRFEYPFPDTNGSRSSSGFSSPEASTSPSSNSFPTLSTSSQMLTQLSFPPSTHRPSYNITHPKMKVQVDPPIPPNLVKRRLRWNLNLNLLGRRRSSATSTTNDQSTVANATDGQQATSPPGSPIQERAKH